MFWAIISGKAFKWGAGVVLVVALIAGSWYTYHSVYESGFQKAHQAAEIEKLKYREAQQAAADKISIENAKTEEHLRDQARKRQEEKEIEIQAINASHQLLLDSLQRRPSRARRSVAASSPNTPVAAVDGPREGSDGTTLSREDAGFLAGEAAAADTLRQIAQSCRDLYNNLLEPIGKLKE
jgi:hypothetical protein